jgi:predicted kinase
MQTKVINLRGSNGSGKSSTIKSLLLLSDDKYYLTRNGKIYATVLDDMRYAVIGYYAADKAMGGVDNISTMVELKSILLELVELYKGYTIVFEGMLISTTTTMYNYMLQLQKSHNIIPFVVVLKSTPEGCLKRIEQRRGSPLERTELVTQKCELVLRHKYQPEHVAYLDVDNTSKSDMLPTFLKLIGDDLTLNAYFPKS